MRSRQIVALYFMSENWSFYVLAPFLFTDSLNICQVVLVGRIYSPLVQSLKLHDFNS